MKTHKGKLIRENNTWAVVYINTDGSKLHLPLYPGPLPLPEGMGIDDYLYEGHEIDFVSIGDNGITQFAKPIIPRDRVSNNKIPTAEEILDILIPYKEDVSEEENLDSKEQNIQTLKDWVGLYVENVLKVASENATVMTLEEGFLDTVKGIWVTLPKKHTVNKDSILKSYPLDRIK